MQVLVADDRAVPIRRPERTSVIFLNQSAVDVYFDTDFGRLNATIQGAVPNGTRIAATTGQASWALFPGVIYVRAATPTTLEVTP